MAKDIDDAGEGTAAGPEAGPDKSRESSQETSRAKANLPQVVSPRLSPGEAEESEDTEDAAVRLPQTAIALIATPRPGAGPNAKPRTTWSPRKKRAALLAASVALAAALGAVVGAVSSGGFGTPQPRTDVAAVHERQAVQKSIAHLNKEVASLKSSLDAANKAAHSQVAKISERLAAAGADITGSISAPRTVTPLPLPRPAQRQEPRQEPRIAAVETQSPARLAVVPDWSIREARDGFIYVEGHGETYQVVPGAPLPGLGPVQTITQREGRWVVVTPRGIIVAARDRGYFERF